MPVIWQTLVLYVLVKVLLLQKFVAIVHIL